MIELMGDQMSKVHDLNFDVAKELHFMESSLKKVALTRDDGF